MVPRGHPSPANHASQFFPFRAKGSSFRFVGFARICRIRRSATPLPRLAPAGSAACGPCILGKSAARSMLDLILAWLEFENAMQIQLQALKKVAHSIGTKKSHPAFGTIVRFRN